MAEGYHATGKKNLLWPRRAIAHDAFRGSRQALRLIHNLDTGVSLHFACFALFPYTSSGGCAETKTGDYVCKMKKRGQTSKKRMAKREDGMPTYYITLQRLSSNFTGKCQNYQGIGPLTRVSLEKEPTLPEWNATCLWGNMVLRIRTYTITGQKLESNPYSLHWECERWHGPNSVSIHPDWSVQLPNNSSASLEKAKQLETASTVAASVPLSQMVKLGRLILPKFEVVTLHFEESCIAKRERLQPIEVTLSLDKSSFMSGGFRVAHKTTSISVLPPGKYVLKRYRKDRVNYIYLFQWRRTIRKLSRWMPLWVILPKVWRWKSLL